MKHAITIAGGGLSGLSLGIALRQRGVQVTIHEAGTYPRHRVCGEFICGVRPDTLTALGIPDIFDHAPVHHSTAWFMGAERIRTAPLPAPGVGISRYLLDETLQQKFRDSGGILLTSSRAIPSTEPGFLWAAGRVPAKGRWVGLKCHTKNLTLSADLEMHLGRNGYVGLSKIENNRVNICGLFRRDPAARGKGSALLKSYLRAGGLAALAEQITEPDEDSFAAVAGFRMGYQNSSAPGLGDSFGMIPPFTGNGMSMAFESAEAALDPMTQYAEGKAPWPDAIAELHSRLATRFRARMFWARAIHPFLTIRPAQALLAGTARWIPFDTFFRALR